jgi:MFS family permease
MIKFKKLYAILVMVCCGLFVFSKYVLQVYPGMIATPLMQAFQLDATHLGYLASFYFYAYLVAQLLAGPLVDATGLRISGTLAIIVGAIGAWWFAHATTFWSAGLARACMGLASGFAVVCYFKSAVVFFEERHLGLINGLMVTAVVAGAIWGQIPLAYCVQHWGWQSTLRQVGYAMFGLSLLFFALNNRQEMTQAFQWRLLKNLINYRNLLLLCYSGLIFMPLSVFGGLWGAPFLAACGFTTHQTGWLISLAYIGFGLGSPLLGYIADRFQRRFAVMCYSTYVTTFALLMVLYLPWVSALWLGFILFIFGFSLGGFVLCFQLTSKINLPMLAATAIALVNSGDALLGAITEPLIGMVLDHSWTGITNAQGVHVFSQHAYIKGLSLLLIYAILACILITTAVQKIAKRYQW